MTSALWLAWRGVHAMTFYDILMLPLGIWFTCVMFHVVVRGGRYEITKANEKSSLAHSVWNFYTSMLFIYWIFNQ